MEEQTIEQIFAKAEGKMKIECPYCHHPYDIEESLSGQNVECGVCNQKFTVPEAPVIRLIDTVKSNKKIRKNIIIGICGCLVLGIATNIFNNFILIFAIPLYLAAIVLSIVAILQRRIGLGIFFLTLTILFFSVNVFRLSGIERNESAEEYKRIVDEIDLRNKKLAEAMNAYEGIKTLIGLLTLAVARDPTPQRMKEMSELNEKIKEVDLVIEQERAALERLNSRKEELRLKHNF